MSRSDRAGVYLDMTALSRVLAVALVALAAAPAAAITLKDGGAPPPTRSDPEPILANGATTAAPPSDELSRDFETSGTAAAGFVAGAFASPVMFLAVGVLAPGAGPGAGTLGALASLALASTCAGVAATWSTKALGPSAATVGTIAGLAAFLGGSAGAGVGAVVAGQLPSTSKASIDANRMFAGGAGALAVGVIATVVATGLADAALSSS